MIEIRAAREANVRFEINHVSWVLSKDKRADGITKPLIHGSRWQPENRQTTSPRIQVSMAYHTKFDE